MEWNKDRLIDKYMDNASSVSAEAGISSVSKASSSPGPGRSRRNTRGGSRSTGSKKTVPPPEPFLCPICFDDGQKDTLALACGHAFCTSCWATYIVSKVRGEGEHHITCMAEDCSIVAPDLFIHHALAVD